MQSNLKLASSYDFGFSHDQPWPAALGSDEDRRHGLFIVAFCSPSSCSLHPGKTERRSVRERGDSCVSPVLCKSAFNILSISYVQILAFHGVHLGFLLKTCGIYTQQIGGDALVYLRLAPRFTLWCLFLPGSLTPEGWFWWLSPTCSTVYVSLWNLSHSWHAEE